MLPLSYSPSILSIPPYATKMEENAPSNIIWLLKIQEQDQQKVSAVSNSLYEGNFKIFAKMSKQNMLEVFICL